MDNKRLYGIVYQFRKAIVAARKHGDFDRFDRMSNFPGGCCDDSCDLLAYYLKSKYSIVTKQYNGDFDDGVFEHRTKHVWLVYNDTIIDITYSQFSFYTNSFDDIYFGPSNKLYNSLEDVFEQDNCDIRNNDRLWRDYQEIIKYL